MKPTSESQNFSLKAWMKWIFSCTEVVYFNTPPPSLENILYIRHFPAQDFFLIFFLGGGEDY